jgi:hypothetical protein
MGCSSHLQCHLRCNGQADTFLARQKARPELGIDGAAPDFGPPALFALLTLVGCFDALVSGWLLAPK